MKRPGSWYHPDPGTALAGVAVSALLVAAVWNAPARFRELDRERDTLAVLPADQRELVGASSVDLDQTFLREARRLLPPRARYAVVTGDRVQVSSPVTLAAVAPYTGYYLMPRAQVPDPRQADWVLSFGGDLEALGLRYARVVAVSEGVAIARVRR